LGVRWEPASLGGLALSAGVYGFTLPDAFIMGDNADKGWEVRLLPAFTLGADYYLDEAGRGVSFGAALVTTTLRLRSDRVAGDASYQALYVVPRVSYTWFIWRGLYVTPWLGVELHVKLAGEPEIGGQRFEPFFINPSPNLNIGYRF
jgi:hypothetical protein